MLRRSASILMLGAVLTATVTNAGPPVDLLNPPQGQFVDEWLVLNLGDQKVGYGHSTMSREGDQITTRTLTVFRIGRAAQVVEVSLLATTRESINGAPQFFDSLTKTGMIEMHTRGVIDAGHVQLNSSQFGVGSEQTHDVAKNAKMAWGIFRAQAEHGLRAGTSYELDVYEPAIRTDATIRAKMVVGGPETVDLFGKKRESVKITTTMSAPTGTVKSVGYVDKRGMPLRVEVQMAGIAMTMLSCDKKIALKAFDPPEFFMDTLIGVDRRIDTAATQAIQYTLHVTGHGRHIPPLPETSMQTPIDRTKQTVRLKVRRVDRTALSDAAPVTRTADIAEYLEASPTINIGDDAIVQMAETAAGGETKPYAIADRLRRYVTDIIQDKNLNIGFATASEVCRKREGDCTEHAVLLAALGRARGIPSRIVVGLAYVENFAHRKNIFGFHMWTQFRIGGKWVDFDAALRESDCSPARIALATSSLSHSGVGDIAFAIMDIITGLEIKIDDIKLRPKPSNPK